MERHSAPPSLGWLARSRDQERHYPCGAHEQMSNNIQRLNPPQLFDASQNHHSHISVVAPGSLAFFSGQVAWTASGTPPPATLAGQAELVASHLQTCLDAVRATPQDIAMMRIYVVDLTPARTQAVFPALQRFLQGAHPSMTGIGVQALAGPDLQIEIEMVVRVP